MFRIFSYDLDLLNCASVKPFEQPLLNFHFKYSCTSTKAEETMRQHEDRCEGFLGIEQNA